MNTVNFYYYNNILALTQHIGDINLIHITHETVLDFTVSYLLGHSFATSQGYTCIIGREQKKGGELR